MQEQKALFHTFDHIEQIGLGGGGTVFRAYHKRLDTDVVLKKIHVDKLGSIDRKAERDILLSLKHPYIPKIFDFLESGDDVFTVMEFIPGQSFAQLLEQKKTFRQNEVVKWARQLCEVVAYLHARRPPIIHCDIKPANIMLTSEGSICLIDFNISGVKTETGIASVGYSDGYSPVEQFAHVADRLTKRIRAGVQNTVYSYTSSPVPDVTEIDTDITEVDEDVTEIDTDMGEADREMTKARMYESGKETYSGMTPVMVMTEKSLLKTISDENWNKARQIAVSLGEDPVIDERTDIYSIGATLYHIITGRKPAPFYETYVPVREGNPGVSESFAYVIDKAMSRMPSDRFKSSAKLLKTVRNMAKIDGRYRRLVRMQIASTAVLAAMTAGSVMMVSFGKNRMDAERWDTYDAYVRNMEERREAGDYEGVNDEYILAVELMPDGQDAYYEMAMAYVKQKEYEKCIDFLENQVFSNSALIRDSSYSRFYYIDGRCRLESEDYKGAVGSYQEAVALQPEEISYYSDYVIALVRDGQIDDAEAVLQQAVDRNVSGDVLSLLQGEIALAKRDYETAEKALQECIAISEDDYNLLRAYTKLDEVYGAAYREAEQYEKRIDLLTDAVKSLPEKEQITLIERLAQVYIDYGGLTGESDYDRKAIELFRLTEERGYATFQNRIEL